MQQLQGNEKCNMIQKCPNIITLYLHVSDDHHEANLGEVVHAVEVHGGDLYRLAGLCRGVVRAEG